MRQLSRNFYAIEEAAGWHVYGVTGDGYSFTIAGTCEGFETLRHARTFALTWATKCGAFGVSAPSPYGRALAAVIKESYLEWQEHALSEKQKRA